MACNCSGKKRGRAVFTATFPDGTRKSYATEVEAKAAVSRKGGSYRRQ